MRSNKAFLLSPIALAVLTMMGEVSAQQPPAPPPEAKPDAKAEAKAAEAKKTETVDRHRLPRLARERAQREARGQRHRRRDQGRGHRQVPRHQPGRGAAAHPGRRDRPRRGRGPQHHRARPRASDFTRIRINGIEALATTGGTDSSGGNNRSRGFDFNVFASELFNQITVRKSSSADVDEGSLGATVDLRTARPVRLPRLQVAPASVQARYNDLSEKTDPRAVLPDLQHLRRQRESASSSRAPTRSATLLEEGFSTVRWDNGAVVGRLVRPDGRHARPTRPTRPRPPAARPRRACRGCPARRRNIAAYNAASNAANFHPRLPRYGRLTHDQDRTGVTGALQFRPRDRHAAHPGHAVLASSRPRARRTSSRRSRSAAPPRRAASRRPACSTRPTAPTGRCCYGIYNGVDIRAESRFDELDTKFTQPTPHDRARLQRPLKLIA